MPEINDLSEREREILSLVAKGASNKQIAQALCISANTVKVHLRNIFAKIEVTSRTEAAMFAVGAGLVDPGNGDRGGSLAGLRSQELADGRAGGLASGFPSRGQAGRERSRWVLLGGAVLLLALGLTILFTLRGQVFPMLASASQQAPASLPRWQDRALLASPRQGLAVAAYGNLIYAIAGESARGISGVVEAYDPEQDRWTRLADKPLPVADVGAAAISGKIYVPGGRVPGGGVTDVLEIYDPMEDRWEKGVSLPAPLSAYALAVFEGKLLLFGGWDGRQAVDSVIEFDPDRNEWRSRTPMPTARAFAGAALANGKIYVFGGFDGERPLAVNEVYLPDRDDGQEVAWQAGTPLPEGRYAMGVASVADIIHVFGGVSEGEGSPPSLEYPPQTETWQPFDSPLSQSWSRLGLAPLGTRLYLVGGGLEGIPSARNLEYQAVYVISLPIVR